MNKENTQKLFEQFPNFFRGHDTGDPRKTLMVFGFDCNDGWFNLIYELCEDIERMLNNEPELKKEFTVLQVKEKFAGLRFYVGSATEEIFDRIYKAEEESYTICEHCGNTGEPRWNLPWKLTLCNKCYITKLKEIGGKI